MVWVNHDTPTSSTRFGTTLAAPQMWHMNSAHMNSAELLWGFFSFYATDFVWGSRSSAMVDEGMDEGMDEGERRGKKTSEQPVLGIKFIKSRVVLH